MITLFDSVSFDTVQKNALILPDPNGPQSAAEEDNDKAKTKSARKVSRTTVAHPSKGTFTSKAGSK